MIKNVLPLVALLSLAACSGNPLGPGDRGGSNGNGGTGGAGGTGGSSGTGGDEDGNGSGTGPIDTGGALPPGTANPSRNDSIFRYEARSPAGTGFAERPSYNALEDTFTIDNLAFDGGNTYTRDTRVPSLGPQGQIGPFAVYENPAVVFDPVNGLPIPQLPHKAIFAATDRTAIVVVRTGGYTDFGFGGFVYQRSGGVTLPTTGQARFQGAYAGLRDFSGQGGLEYSTGTVTLDVDFEDFNGTSAHSAIKGRIDDRRVFDTAGNDITQSILDALGVQYGGAFTALPTLMLDIGPNTITGNGEAFGELGSRVVATGSDGATTIEAFEAGKYYAILAGNNPDEIAGVLVVEAPDPRWADVTVRETGGFIAER